MPMIGIQFSVYELMKRILLQVCAHYIYQSARGYINILLRRTCTSKHFHTCVRTYTHTCVRTGIHCLFIRVQYKELTTRCTKLCLHISYFPFAPSPSNRRPSLASTCLLRSVREAVQPCVCTKQSPPEIL